MGMPDSGQGCKYEVKTFKFIDRLNAVWLGASDINTRDLRMKPIPDPELVRYPENEKPALDELKDLFCEWNQLFEQHIELIKKQGSYYKHEDMVCDGFYPHYFGQKTRVLFVGKESMGMSGQNYIESMHSVYTKTKKFGRIGGKGEIHLNQSKFQSRLLKFAYALTNGLPAWEDIPQATKIGDTLGTMGGVSFAFMNLSKFSAHLDHWQANDPLIAASNQISESGGFIEKEVCILKPSLIITMNFEHSLKLFGTTERIDANEKLKTPTLYQITSGGHKSWLINTFHFSAWQKKDRSDFYDPICELIREHLPSIAMKK